MLGYCGVFYGLARKAYERTSTAQSDTAEGQYDALDAIILSVVTLESFIGELAEFTRFLTFRASEEKAKRGKTLSDALSLIEEDKGQLTLKFQLAKFILTGTSYNTGANPYQDFDLLVKLRNALIHPKAFVIKPDEAGDTVDPVRRLREQLRSRGVCAQTPADFLAPLSTLVSTRAAARWACNAAVSMAQSLFEPSGGDQLLEDLKKISPNITPID